MSDFHIPSYSEIYRVGHKYVENIFDGVTEFTEKADGSFAACCKIDGQFYARSKKQQLIVDNPEKMFGKFIENLKNSDLHDKWIYYGEVLQSPKHNCLSYSRVPKKNFIIFGIAKAEQDYLSYEEMQQEANRLDLEVVPLLFRGKIEKSADLDKYLKIESILGGCQIEGVVCKRFDKFGPDKKVLMAKLVREDFKELNQKEWRVSNPTLGDIINTLISELKTDARILKAIQHLKDDGKLTFAEKDISEIIHEVENDIKKEEEDYIKQKLFDFAWAKIRRGVVRGIPHWYKKKLIENVINENMQQM